MNIYLFIKYYLNSTLFLFFLETAENVNEFCVKYKTY